MSSNQIPDDVRTCMQSDAQSAGRKCYRYSAKGLNRKEKILIVDDDPRDVRLLAARLPRKDYQTICAYGGISALKVAQEEAPDLILLDVMLPDINGYEVTKRLKNEPSTRNIPIILLTALNGPEEKTKGLKAGADDFLNKPVHFAELLTRVRSFLRLKEYREKIETITAPQESSAETTEEAWENEKNEDVASILFAAGNEKDDGLIQYCQDAQKCKISQARDGKEAISLISQKEMDLLILNVPLPGTDALDFCRRLKDLEKTKNIQIMVVTNQEDLASIVKMMEFGADDFMVKPVDKNEFKTRIEILLKKKKAADCIIAIPPQTLVSGAINDKL